jgi:hypothetical protein
VSEVVFQETLLKAAFERRRGSIISRVRHLSFSHIHASISCLALFNVPPVLASFLVDFGQTRNAFHFSGLAALIPLMQLRILLNFSLFRQRTPSKQKRDRCILYFLQHSSFYVFGLPFLCRTPVHRSI